MVRTMDSGSRASGGKAPRKGASTPTVSSSSSSKGGSSSFGHTGGGNSACPRETPAWQKPISSFFNKNETSTSPSKETEEKESSIREENTEITKHVDKKEKIANDNEEEKENEPGCSNKKDKRIKRKKLIVDDEDD